MFKTPENRECQHISTYTFLITGALSGFHDAKKYLPSQALSDGGESQMVTRSVPDPPKRRPRTMATRVRKVPTKQKAG